jgi:hypothetical protein
MLRSKEPPAPYIPGQFYLREMPVIGEILVTIAHVELVVVDGYVWLAKGRPGLGAELYERRIRSSAWAKGPFRDNPSVGRTGGNLRSIPRIDSRPMAKRLDRQFPGSPG